MIYSDPYMSNRRTFEAWVVAHSTMGVEVKTAADRDGQCRGGGKRVTFEAEDVEIAKAHEVHCEYCWTDQPVAGVSGPINVNII